MGSGGGDAGAVVPSLAVIGDPLGSSTILDVRFRLISLGGNP